MRILLAGAAYFGMGCLVCVFWVGSRRRYIRRHSPAPTRASAPMQCRVPTVDAEFRLVGYATITLKRVSES